MPVTRPAIKVARPPPGRRPTPPGKTCSPVSRSLSCGSRSSGCVLRRTCLQPEAPRDRPKPETMRDVEPRETHLRQNRGQNQRQSKCRADPGCHRQATHQHQADHKPGGATARIRGLWAGRGSLAPAKASRARLIVASNATLMAHRANLSAGIVRTKLDAPQQVLQGVNPTQARGPSRCKTRCRPKARRGPRRVASGAADSASPRLELSAATKPNAGLVQCLQNRGVTDVRWRFGGVGRAHAGGLIQGLFPGAGRDRCVPRCPYPRALQEPFSYSLP